METYERSAAGPTMGEGTTNDEKGVPQAPEPCVFPLPSPSQAEGSALECHCVVLQEIEKPLAPPFIWYYTPPGNAARLLASYTGKDVKAEG